jgi:hypothetical protein
MPSVRLLLVLRQPFSHAGIFVPKEDSTRRLGWAKQSPEAGVNQRVVGSSQHNDIARVRKPSEVREEKKKTATKT